MRDIGLRNLREKSKGIAQIAGRRESDVGQEGERNDGGLEERCSEEMGMDLNQMGIS